VGIGIVSEHVAGRCMTSITRGLKGGRELRPWAPCLARLATTPDEATRLLADAVAVLDARAHAAGQDNTPVWEPTPDAPALVIVIDEYAELADTAPAAVAYAESVARRGRGRRRRPARGDPTPDAESDGRGRTALIDERPSLPTCPRAPGR